MNRRCCLMVIWILLGLTASIHAETLRFAPLPMVNPEVIVKQFRPLSTFLETYLKIDIEFEYSENYAEILTKFEQSKIDFAYLGPLPYVELRAKFAGAEPIVHFRESSGEAAYTCAIVAFPDYDFDLANPSGRRIALTQPLSTCGYLSTTGLLHQSGSSLANNRYRYLGKHDLVALAVARGEFDAGGLTTAIAKKYTHPGLQELSETPPLPGFALVGNTLTLTPELVEKIRSELIALDSRGKDWALLETWGDNIRNGAVPASDNEYQVVRELLRGTDIPWTGNF